MIRRLLFSALVVALVSLLVGGSTLAYFTSQSTNNGNQYVTGTVSVDVSRDLGDPIPGPMFYTENANGDIPAGYLGVTHPTGQWYPGKSETRVLDVHNTGTLDFRVDGVQATLHNITDPAQAAHFAQKLNVRITDNVGTLVLYDGPLAGLLGAWVNVPFSQQPYVAAGGSTYPLHFKATLDTSAGNSIQGIVPLVDFSIHVIQARNIAGVGLTNPGFETGDFTGWTLGTVVDSAGVTGADSYTSPYQGSKMALLGTPASSGQPVGPNELYQNFVANQPTLKFAYNLFTHDYIGFNHFGYDVTVVDPMTGAVVASYHQTAWGSGAGLKSTGWQVVTLDISGHVGETLKLYFNLAGTSDTLYNTWVYIDSAE